MKPTVGRALLSSLLVLAAACGHGPSSPSAPSFAGEWSGTTSQGTPITFTVTADLQLTALTIGYNFNGCLGSASYAPNVALLRIPTLPVPAYSVTYQSGPVGSANRALVNFFFTSASDAHGTIIFTDYPECGAGLTEAVWTATRR